MLAVEEFFLAHAKQLVVVHVVLYNIVLYITLRNFRDLRQTKVQFFSEKRTWLIRSFVVASSFQSLATPKSDENDPSWVQRREGDFPGVQNFSFNTFSVLNIKYVEITHWYATYCSVDIKQLTINI